LFDREIENKIIEIGFLNNTVHTELKTVRDIPEQDLWFESVWKDYIKDIYLEC
jgi:hypothetical protein